MKKEYQICTKCIMDTLDSKITFDENGVCNYCKIYEKKRRYLYSEKELEKEVKKIKESGKGKKYDCLIALSGGVDSSMAAHLAKKLGLRPLGIHLDNGWDSEIAQANIEGIVKKLNIDLYTYVIEWEEFKDLQLSFLKASVPNIDFPNDHAIFSLYYNTAARLGVEYVITGANIETESITPQWGYTSLDSKHLKAIHKKFGKVKLKTYPMISLWRIVYYSFVKKIKRFSILNYIDYDKQKAKEFLKKELNWQDYGDKHCESIYTRFFINYIQPRKFNFDRRRAYLSNLIHSGQMTREKALEEINRSPYLTKEMGEEDKNYVIKKLGLTNEEFEKIMSLPIKNHEDYPNYSLFFEKLIFIYSFLKKLLVK